MKTIHRPYEEKQSTELAVGTFIICTILFAAYIISNESAMILVIAWPFALAAIIVNAIMLVHLADQFIRLSQHRKDIAVKLLMLLSNIPILFFYYLIAMKP